MSEKPVIEKWETWEIKAKELAIQNDVLRRMVIDRDTKLQELQTQIKELQAKKSKKKRKK